VRTEVKEILEEALALPPRERANLIDRLLSSLDEPSEHIDSLWRKEVEDRIGAYRSGKMKSVPLDEVLSRHRE
jgi:putative addiction module component (TIGR02574 family)